MKQVLIAVLSSLNEPYRTMLGTAKATWDSQVVENAQTVFYTGAPETALVDRVKGFDANPNDLYSIGKRCLLAYEWMLANLEWDIMCRTNASSYVYKPNLVRYCQGLDARKLVSGCAVRNADPPWMWGGYHYLFSRDVIQELVDHKDRWDHSIMEDVAMSRVLTSLGYTFDRMHPASSIEKTADGWKLISTVGMGFDFKDFSELKGTEHFLFRCKQDLQRHLDIHIMQQLFKHL